MILKTNLSDIIIFFLFLTGTTAFSQKITREEVDTKLTKSWTATETGKPGEALSQKRHREIMYFKHDGSVTIEKYSDIMGNTISNVLWGFDEAKQKLVLTLPNGSLSGTQEFEIIELTGDKLVLMSPENQTVYIPTEITKKNPSDDVLDKGLNPSTWSGKLQYNIVVITDHYYKTSKEKVPGLITLEKIGERQIIKKKELGSTITWTIEAVTYIANKTSYTAVCSDLNLNGDISFQNGFMLLEIYDPKYLSYLWAVE